MLLAAGADLNAVDDSGTTPISIAAQEGHHQIVEILLAAGANLGAFFRAWASGDLKTVDLFISMTERRGKK